MRTSLRFLRRSLSFGAAGVMSLGVAFAQDGKPAAPPEPVPFASVTQHEVTIGGEKVSYVATAGWLVMKDDKQKPIARFGYTAYTKSGGVDPASRPITFAFNGGPGSSSMWLHMGILGPRRVVVDDANYAPPPPSRCVENEFSPLDVTDLVMIDPVGTGFSKPLGDAKGADFWGVDQDIRSVGAFIQRYVTENGRWASPKYILGESYGGVRGAGLVQHLQSTHGMNFNGLVLVSPFLSVVSGRDGVAIDLPHVLFLPTFAATAWYHDAIPEKPRSLDEFIAEVERFAYDEYAPALMKGYAIGAEEKAAIAAKLAKFTGTAADYWMKADLRVSHQQFLQELRRSDRLVTGRIDSRFAGPALNPLAERMDYDPFTPAVGPAFTAALHAYQRADLGIQVEDEYVRSASGLEWDWRHRQPGTGRPGDFTMPMTNTVPDLAMAMTMNPGLHVLVQHGRFDMATPFLAMKYDLDHLDVAPEARKRIRVQYFEAGHMMYLHGPSARLFRESLVGFIRDTDRL